MARPPAPEPSRSWVLDAVNSRCRVDRAPAVVVDIMPVQQPPSLSPGLSFGRRTRVLQVRPSFVDVDRVRVDGRALVLAVVCVDPDDGLNWVLVAQGGRVGWILSWHL